MHLKQVFQLYGRLDRKTYLLWSLPFILFMAILLTSEFFGPSERLLMRFIDGLEFLGLDNLLLLTLALITVSGLMVFFLSAKRFQDLNKPWYYGFLMLLGPLFFLLYPWLVLKEGTIGENDYGEDPTG